MNTLVLKTGVALAALIVAVPAAAHTAETGARAGMRHRPAVSPAFQRQSQITATRTVRIVQTGTPDMSGPQDAQAGDAQVWGDATPVVNCPDGPTDTADWRVVPEDLRKIARPGQCYSRLLIAPKFETYSEHELVAEAHTETRVVPAVTHTEMVTEVVRPASVREEHVAARYETRVEHVMSRAPQRTWTRSRGIPTGAALVTPDDHQPVAYRRDGTLEWPGKHGYDSQDVPVDDQTAAYLAQGSAQDVWCLDQSPGQYETRKSRVEVSPETVRRVEIPAVTRQVEHVVVDSPEHTESYEVPAVYRDVEKQRIVGQPKTVWREVLCSKNATPKVIMSIQRALAAKGYQPGPIDGHLGTQTVSAMQRFQADNDLPQGQVSVEAVQMLGVDLLHR